MRFRTAGQGMMSIVKEYMSVDVLAEDNHDSIL